MAPRTGEPLEIRAAILRPVGIVPERHRHAGEGSRADQLSCRAHERRTARIEYNIEGDARPELIDLVEEVRPDQCTLVPVAPGEVTSQAGWQPGNNTAELPATT